ncbi:MAG: sodium:solute symporter [Phycisphaeraceae bacterium]
MAPLMLAAFVPLDWLVLSSYLLLLIATSWWLSRREQHDTTDYFLAGRRIPAWAAAFSVMATSISATTFVGAPGIAYGGNLAYLSSFIGTMLAAVIVALVFIPVFYKHNVATVYSFLEIRFGPSAKRTASAMFMVGRVFASGARLYIGALAAAFLFFNETAPGYVTLAILAVTLVGIVYTFAGGIEAVVWADVIQSFVFISAAVFSIFLLLYLIPAGIPEIWTTLAETTAGTGESKLTLISFSLDFSQPYTLLAAVFGFTLIGIGAYGTDQDLTQRMLTCRNAAQGARSALAGIFMTVPVAFLFLIVGLLLFVFYQQGDVAAPEDGREVFLDFIVHHIPAGIAGLMMAGLFAAALSSLNSELNAMSSTLINDFYRTYKPDRSEAHYLLMGRMGIVFWGVALGAFAILCAYWQHASEIPLIDFALGIMMFAYSGLVAVFLTALLTNRGSTTSVLAALAVGFLAILTFQVEPWIWFNAEVDLAFPWQMTIATTAAFLVCCLGNTPAPIAPPTADGAAAVASAAGSRDSLEHIETAQVQRK